MKKKEYEKLLKKFAFHIVNHWQDWPRDECAKCRFCNAFIYALPGAPGGTKITHKKDCPVLEAYKILNGE